MLNHDTGQMDWDAGRAQGPAFPASSFSVSPDNLFDPSTPRGRELLDEVYPSSTADVENEVSPHARWIVAAVLIVMFIGLFLIPGHS